METFAYVVFMIYAILGVGVTAFIVWILPSLVMVTWDAISPFVMAEWNSLVSKVDVFLIDLKEHYEFLEREKGRHRKMDVDNFFGCAVLEMREIREGRRLPVSISGCSV